MEREGKTGESERERERKREREEEQMSVRGMKEKIKKRGKK